VVGHSEVMAKTPYTGQKSACGKFEIRRIRGEQIVPNAAAFSVL